MLLRNVTSAFSAQRALNITYSFTSTFWIREDIFVSVFWLLISYSFEAIKLVVPPMS